MRVPGCSSPTKRGCSRSRSEGSRYTVTTLALEISDTSTSPCTKDTRSATSASRALCRERSTSFSSSSMPSPRAPNFCAAALTIRQPGRAARHRFGERARAAGALADVDREHGEGPALQSAAQALDARHLFAAGGAPGGPEIDQHRLAAVIGKTVRGALEILQLQRRRGASAPGSQRLRRGKRRPGEQQRSQEPPPHQVISRARIAYTNASGSSWSSLSLPVSPFGYMRYGSFGPFECGSAMS